jgi:predicted DNA binding CopG/RHH family protein
MAQRLLVLRSMEKLKAVTIRLSPELWKEVKILCSVLEIPIYKLITDAVERILKDYNYRG